MVIEKKTSFRNKLKACPYIIYIGGEKSIEQLPLTIPIFHYQTNTKMQRQQQTKYQKLTFYLKLAEITIQTESKV